MTFLWPFMLFALILVPVLIILYLRLQQRRRKIARDFGSMGFGSAAMPQPGLRRYIPPAFFLVGLIVLITALARPQTVVSLPRIEGTVVLAFDVSGSMAADDMKPNRMEAAKTAARDFVERQPNGVQIGVTAFSDNGFSIQVPTNDRDAVLSAINRMTPQHGTSLAHGIQASLTSINSGINPGPLTYSDLTPVPTLAPTPVPQGTFSSGVIVLLTDGDNNEPPDPLLAAQQAADRGVRIYTVGIGSPTGTTLHINGFNVSTRLDETILQEIAETTGGVYYNAANAEDLVNIYDNLKPQLIIKPSDTEVTSLFSGASILILLIGGALSLLWFNRLI